MIPPASNPFPLPVREIPVYLGTYTERDGSRGIYSAIFDSGTGALGEPVPAAEMENPTFLAVAPGGTALYAVSEISKEGQGRVAAYRILPSGALEKIDERSSRGGGPCHVSIHPDGKVLALANYGGGSVASYRIEADGTLSEAVSTVQHRGGSTDSERQRKPHAHSIHFSPDGCFAYAADLGTDRLYLYSVDAAEGALRPMEETPVAAGSGPRQFAIRPDGRFAYAINEMALTVTAFRVDVGTGRLREVQTIGTLPRDTARKGAAAAEVACHPEGRFLYGSNRRHDTLVLYEIGEESGELSWILNEPVRGRSPRHFVITPDGDWLLAACEDSDTITIFRIDRDTGSLEYTGHETVLGSPVCVRFGIPRQGPSDAGTRDERTKSPIAKCH